MAGAFGYEAEHHATSLQMAELTLLPAVRAAAADTLIVADGTSCRHQTRDGGGRVPSKRRGSWPMPSLTGRRAGRLDGRGGRTCPEGRNRVGNMRRCPPPRIR
jgi:hypothetical protein